MSEILETLSVPAAIHAIEANQFEFLALLRHLVRAEVHDEAELLWSISDVPIPLCNFIVRARLAPGRVDAVIEAAIARGRAGGVPRLWYVGPATRPADLGTALTAHGFVHEVEQPGMAADLQALPEPGPDVPGFTLAPVTDDASFAQWCAAAIAGFGIPAAFSGVLNESWGQIGFGAHAPIRHYLGRLNGEPVATSSLLLAAGVAGIYNVSTIPAARRKGIGAQMTRGPLLDARALGYRVGILHATRMGLNVYRQLGFEEYCTLGHYVWTPEGGAE